tara:strand:- start:590 stop:1213 length:624 start_codon:yes stop_codon:yes gene_type:complete
MVDICSYYGENNIMNNFLVGLVLFGSLSMRTANDINFQDTPDYEVSIGVKNKNLFLNRQWERQDGLNYVDDEYWFKTEPGDFYIKPQYVNKASRDLKYTKLDLRYKPDSFKGFSVGYTGFDYGNLQKNSISVGYQYNKDISDKWKVAYMLDGYVAKTSVANNRIDYENYIEFKYKFSDKLSLVSLFDYNNFRGIEFYKMKVGVEYEL